ncbi:unnamed protein product [Trichogramma brassicae]|uniref:Cytochrome P450 n=1 Tax=Trichogramma brassicae TaxID=86971 RepID=A0A6H5IEJ4_9HYME|nr:unnamed protein product [Trichogramma brassicae]
MAHLILGSFFLLNLAICVAYVAMRRAQRYWKRRGVKSVKGATCWGHFKGVVLARRPLRDVLRDLYERGRGQRAIGFYVFAKPFLVLRDPELIKSVLVRDFKCFANRCIAPRREDYIGYVNIFALRSPAWKLLRQRLTPVFTASKLRHMFEGIVETAAELDAHLAKLVVDDENDDDDDDDDDDRWTVVEVKELCEKFTTDVIGLTMFGMKLNALRDDESEFRREGKKHFQNSYARHLSLVSLFFMPWLARLLRISFFDADVPNFFKRVIPEAMAERAKSGAKRNDLLDAFIEIKNAYANDPDDEMRYYFQDDGLVATSIVFFLGGFEPSASMMYFTLYELAKQPDLQSRLRREILAALEVAASNDEEEEPRITYDMANGLPYLEQVCCEALRKYPLLHFLDREAEEDYELDPESGLTIERGTPVIIPMSALHMDPDYYPDPDRFDPERFSSQNLRKIPAFAYLPFGQGPRNCIGMRIGLMQSKVGLMQILSKYEVSPCRETPVPLEFDSYTLFTKSKHNMKLNVRRVRAERR